MPDLPETRESLLLRLADAADIEAWQEFAEIYRPAAYRLARRRGMQDADAEDLAQTVLLAISQKIGEWRATKPTGSFRAWLATVARNQIVNALTRRRPDRGTGGTSTYQRLEQELASTETDGEFDEEFRRAIFRLASELVRDEFQESTWLAFWLSAVEGRPIDEVARQLGKRAGAVYASRSRVMQRLKQKVHEIALPETPLAGEREASAPPGRIKT
ncbi:MAG: RNA polymerase sigma factor [Planctomycetaceae bacterium]